MDLSCKPQYKPDYRLEQLDGELLLYHPSRTTIMYCNASAHLVWQLCDGQRTVEEMATLLSAAYEQPLEAMTAELTDILDQFYRHGAIECPGRKSG
jgi:hypothetical protein